MYKGHWSFGHYCLGPERRKNESYNKYKRRLKIEKEITKIILGGTKFWPSGKWGTYVKDRDGWRAKSMDMLVARYYHQYKPYYARGEF